MRQLKTRGLFCYGSMILPVALMRKNEGEKFSPSADDNWVNGTGDGPGIKTTLTKVDELEIEFIFSITLLLPG
jgi:hypothetical protein